MNKLTKQLIGAGAGLSLLASSVMPVFAVKPSELDGDADTKIGQTITAGVLSMKAPADTTLTAEEVSSGEQTATGQAANLLVDDARGNKPSQRAGWALTVSSSDFSDGDATEESVIDVTNFTVTPSGLGTAAGTDSDGVSLGTGGVAFTSTSNQVNVATAVTGEGEGRYDMDLDLSLVLPENQEVAVYEATMTFTIS